MSLVYHASALIEADGTTTQKDWCGSATHPSAGIYDIAMDALMSDSEALILVQQRNNAPIASLVYTAVVLSDDTTIRVTFQAAGVGVDSRFAIAVWRFMPP